MRPISRRFATAAAVLMIMAAPVATAYADPPSWAPAHGWRAKHEHKHRHKHRDRQRDVHVYHHYQQPTRYAGPTYY